VVILCEPQVKPTVEHQAVARVHRMGQIRAVQVHRLLATDSVDDRLLRILAHKERLFDAFARRSDMADATPDAVDVSDSGLARRIVEEEQQRLTGRAGPEYDGYGRASPDFRPAPHSGTTADLPARDRSRTAAQQTAPVDST
jgi:hypothetical protein